MMVEVIGSALFGALILGYVCDMHLKSFMKSHRNYFIMRVSANDENF